MTYKPTEAARLVECSVASVRAYPSKFPQFFSPSAVPARGTERRFTDSDLRVLRFIAVATAQGETLAEVGARLEAGEVTAFDWSPGEDQPPAAPSQGETAGASTALASIPQVLAQLFQQLDTARRQDQVDARRREDELTRQLLDARERIGRLEGEIAALKAKETDEGVTPPPSFWDRLFGRA